MASLCTTSSAWAAMVSMEKAAAMAADLIANISLPSGLARSPAILEHHALTRQPKRSRMQKSEYVDCASGRAQGKLPMPISRRNPMKGTAALALAGPALPQARAMGRLAVGEGELIIVSDGHMTLPLEFLFPDLPEAELKALLAANGMPTDGYSPDCNVTFLRAGDRL